MGKQPLQYERIQMQTKRWQKYTSLSAKCFILPGSKNKTNETVKLTGLYKNAQINLH